MDVLTSLVFIIAVAVCIIAGVAIWGVSIVSKVVSFVKGIFTKGITFIVRPKRKKA